MKNNKKQRNIPKEWQEKKLGEICEINPRTLELPEKFIYIDLESVVNGKLIKRNEIFKNKAPSRAQRVLRDNDILFQMVRPYQKNNLFFKFGGGYVASTGYAQIRAKYSSMYLYQCLNMQRFVNKVLVRCTGSNYPAINSTDLAKIKIVFPPAPEQKAIVSILETWDKYLEKLSRKIVIKKNIKKGLMQRLLSGDVRLSGFSGAWEEKRLGDISDITTGNSNREDSSLDGKYTFFDRSEDIRSSSIYLFDGEAVIVAGEGQKFVPKYFIGKFDLHQRTYAIMNFNNTDGKFIFYYLYQNKNYLLSQAVGSTVKSLRLPMFVKMPIRLPLVGEQIAIAKILTTADKEIEVLEKKKKIIEDQKKYLLNNLVTGKIRV